MPEFRATFRMASDEMALEQCKKIVKQIPSKPFHTYVLFDLDTHKPAEAFVAEFKACTKVVANQNQETPEWR